ncbi:MAG: lytic murein transglycosylase [Proteobacteria bacterium]|nr:lytic murein transglycosylase [Pseudomonadota bacterium]
MALALAAPAAHAAAPKGPEILTSDVERFYRVYEAHHGHPDAATLDRDYLTPGSPGLHEFMQARRVSGESIEKAIEAHPEAYEDARNCLTVLPNVKRRLTEDFARLARAYPEAKFPPVTIVVGRTRPVGITNPSGVTIGLEALCAASFMNPNPEERFVHIIMHEYGHIQQEGPLSTVDVGQPAATVLTMSLMEGAAELFAELFSGDIGNHEHRALTRGRERAIERAFVRDEDKTDLSDWLYNSKGTAAEPGDLGYWVGYRITKAYYDRAPNKHQALIDILHMTDARAFVAKSGWKPGGRKPAN